MHRTIHFQHIRERIFSHRPPIFAHHTPVLFATECSDSCLKVYLVIIQVNNFSDHLVSPVVFINYGCLSE